MMPMLVEKRTTMPAKRKKARNQAPISLPRIWASSLMNSISADSVRFDCPTVDQTSTESMRSVKRPMQKKVMKCSRLHTFHHDLQRLRFCSFTGKVYPRDGAATSSPVIGETILGMGPPIPNPSSRPLFVRPVLLVQREGVPEGRGGNLLAGYRGDDLGHAPAHPHPLVADVVALAEVVRPARAREGDRPEHGRGPERREGLGQVGDAGGRLRDDARPARG